MNRPRDSQLLSKLAEGDQEAYETLYDQYAPRLLATALRQLGNQQDAEDCVHTVFMSLVRNRRRLNEVRDITAYLFVSLRRAAGSLSAKQAKEPIASQDLIARSAVVGEDQVPQSEHHERLSRAWRRLPKQQREALALKIEGELTFSQIGEVLGIKPSTAATRYRYALEKLRDAMEVTHR